MIRYHSALTPLMVPTSRLRPDPHNANNGDTDAIIESITVLGCYRPVYASRETGQIVAGHHVYAALMEMGAAKVPVIWVDGDSEQATRILLGDNEIARMARMDNALLLNLLNEMAQTERGFLGTGFTDDRYEQVRLAVLDESGWSLALDDSPDPMPHRCPECNHEWFGQCATEPEV